MARGVKKQAKLEIKSAYRQPSSIDIDAMGSSLNKWQKEALSVLKRGVDFWNKWRQKDPYDGPDLSGVNLSGFELRDFNFVNTSFSGANLRGANLSNAYIANAFLENADLSGAHLISTNFYESDLSGANLSNASLELAGFGDANLAGANLRSTRLLGTRLTNADLRGADFTNARFVSTVMGNTDLRGALGLETCTHEGPSIIDPATLARSGVLPLSFLRGVGVPDSFIDYLPSLVGQPIQFFSCFISYSHADKPFARRLYDALQGRGIRCWLDEHQLLPGHDMFEEIDRGIKLWDKVLLCCSTGSLESWWVDNEINSAFSKEQSLTKARGKKVRALIPLNLDDFLFQWENGKAVQVKSRLAADFTGWETDNEKFEEQFERLVTALQTDEGRENPPQSLL